MKDGARLRIDDAAHQEKNEKTDKREAGEDTKRTTEFKEVACCSPAFLQRTEGEKMVCVPSGPAWLLRLALGPSLATIDRRSCGALLRFRLRGPRLNFCYGEVVRALRWCSG